LHDLIINPFSDFYGSLSFFTDINIRIFRKVILSFFRRKVSLSLKRNPFFQLKPMIIIYHNPKCRKSRAGLQYLQEKGLEHTVVEYLKTPFTREKFKELLMKLNMRPLEIVRTQEDEFKEKLKGKNFTDEEWITIILENPKLIQRPIVVQNHKAVLGQPVEEIERLL
jgi:arsenate reductase (glutaredoxin)